jgi:hypothetical protein
MHSSSTPPSQKPEPLSKLSTEQSCSTKLYQWILPLSDRLQETSPRGAEVEEGVHEGDEAGAEPRVAAEVVRERAQRAQMETSSEREGSCVRIQLYASRSYSTWLRRELRTHEFSGLVRLLYQEAWLESGSADFARQDRACRHIEYEANW